MIKTDLKIVDEDNFCAVLWLLLDGLAAYIGSLDFELFCFNLSVTGDAEDASVAAWEREEEVGAVSFVVVSAVGQRQSRQGLPFGRQC